MGETLSVMKQSFRITPIKMCIRDSLGIVNTQDQQVVMALANGYDLLTDCLTTYSTAYAENTALAKEAGAAYGTTANQIQLAKSDIVDAAIRLSLIHI